MISLRKGDQEVVLDGGELISYRVGDYEYIHQKGSPGWGHSDTEMFPLIGPTAEAAYRVQVPRGNALQDQHGLLRELSYKPGDQYEDQVVFTKKYTAGTRIGNSKFPERSTMQWLIWPYGFEFEKSLKLTHEGLEIRFSVSGERDMPYMLGYHPAFKLRTPGAHIRAGDQRVGLQEVIAVGNRALLLPEIQELSLKDERSLNIKTEGFRHFMCWTEVPNMLCIEPITFYPYAVEQNALHEGFDYLGPDKETFTVWLQPD